MSESTFRTTLPPEGTRLATEPGQAGKASAAAGDTATEGLRVIRSRIASLMIELNTLALEKARLEVIEMGAGIISSGGPDAR